MARIIQTKWDDESDEKLRRLTAENLTAGQISARMPGRSRNSIIGRWHRLGLKGGKSQRSRKRVKAPVTQPPAPREPKIHYPKPNFATVTGMIPSRKAALKKLDLSADEPVPRMIALLDLKPRMCRWIHGDVGQDNFGYCGHKTDGKSYCDYHYKISVRGRPAPKLRKAA